MTKLKDRVAVVTGASKGIGAGIASELASAGATVVVNYATDQSGAAAVVDEITTSGGRAIAISGDVSNAADVEGLLVETMSAFGRLDIVVNNAGVYKQEPVDALTEDEFHRQFNINVLGPLLVTRESIKHFGTSGGNIVNIGSRASRSHPPGYSIYSASRQASTPSQASWPRS